MTCLRWTSLMSEVLEPFCSELADYLTRQTGLSIQYAFQEAYTTRRQMVLEQQIDLAWICGVDYVLNATNDRWGYEPLVSACLGDCAQPIYFSHMVVQAKSPFQCFADLRSASFAYNEMESFSGYKILHGHLAQLGEQGPFFGHSIKSGSHLRSLQMVSQGLADTAAIDSSVMQMAFEIEPGLHVNLRAIEQIGPYPMPPLVLSQSCPAETKERVETALVKMHETIEGKVLLNRFHINRFAAVGDSYYDDIRTCLQRSQNIRLY